MGNFNDGVLIGSELVDAIGQMPLDDEARSAFVRLMRGGVDYLDGRSPDEKRAYLKQTSYLDFLAQHAHMPQAVLAVLQDTFLPLVAVGWEAESALEAARWWFPGTWELGIQDEEGDEEPYIFHFPDGNASIARALVRDLIPAAIPGRTMEDLVSARADYSRLDVPGSSVRLRLNSTAVTVANASDGKFADVTYMRDGRLYRGRAKHVVLACYNNIIPYLCDELPDEQVEAIRYATKIPFVIGNVAIRNWRHLRRPATTRSTRPAMSTSSTCRSTFRSAWARTAFRKDRTSPSC